MKGESESILQGWGKIINIQMVRLSSTPAVSSVDGENQEKK
jgi:hypothetical protein